MSNMPSLCPTCGSGEIHHRKSRGDWICDACEHTWTPTLPSSPDGIPTTKTRLFLSYGRRDAKPLADRLHADLEAHGFEVWKDTRQIRSGRAWEQEIEDGLRSTQLVLALLSPHAVRRTGDPSNSDNLDSVCLDELSFARFTQPPRPIVPVMAVRCDPPFCIFRLDYVDMTSWAANEANYQAGLQRILTTVTEALHGEVRYHSWEHNLQPLDFASFLHEKRRDFCGRQWLFDEIDAWRLARSERALLITGDPGTGKSAIVAELVHRNPGGQVLAYHCCQADVAETLKPSRFIRSIAAMIASKLPEYAACLAEPVVENALKESRCIEDPISAFEEGILQPLHTLPAPLEGVRYLFVDALDEALTWTARGVNLVDLLVARLERLPGWLKVVATTRKDRAVLNRLAGLRARELDPQGVENQADLDAFLQLRLENPNLKDRLTASDLSAEQVRRTLLEKSAGNFLYARQALLGIERDQYSFARLQELPPGLFGLYEDFFKRHWLDATAFAAVGRVLEVIVAAREPLTEAQLADATGLDAETELPPILRRLDVFVPLRDGRRQVFHKSLIDWLTHEGQRGLLYYASRRRGHGQLAQRGLAEYQRGVRQMSRYALRHLPAHLTGCERWDDLAALLTNLIYLEMKVEAGWVFELANDFTEAVERMPRKHQRHRMLELLEEALRRDIHFVQRHPSTLFQCLWNTCWWYDCSVAAEHFEEKQSPGQNAGVGLHRLVEAWRAEKEMVAPNFLWVRSMRPPDLHLGTAQRLVLSGHEDSVNSVAFSPDGARIASGGWDSRVIVWDSRTGERLLTLNGHKHRVFSVSFSPDGSRIVSGARDNSVRVWDAYTGLQLLCLTGHAERVYGVSFSPDGSRIVSASKDQTLRLWDARNGEHICCLEGHEEYVDGVAFSPDGLHIVSGSGDNSVRVWDAGTGQQHLCITGHEHYVTGVSYSPDGSRIVSGSWDKTVRVWDAETGDQILCITGHEDYVTRVAYSPDGIHIVSGSNDKTVRVWDARSGQQLCSVTGHEEPVLSVAYSPNGTHVISGSVDHTVRMWDIRSGQQVLRRTGHKHRVSGVSFSPDGSLIASASWDKTVRVWESSSGQQLLCLIGHDYRVFCVSFSPDGMRIVSGSDDMTVRVWDARTGQQLFCLTGHEHSILRVWYSQDGTHIVSKSKDQKIRLWDANTGDCLKEYSSASEHYFSLPKESQPILWSATWDSLETAIETADEKGPIAWFPAALNPLAPHPAGRIWAGAWASHICLITLEGTPPMADATDSRPRPTG